MPFSYPSSASSRARRGKEKDKEKEKEKDSFSRTLITSSGSIRGHKRNSRSSDRSPPRSPLAVAPALYTQQNITLDKLPALPESGATSPSSVTSRPHPRSPPRSTFATSEVPAEATIVRALPPPPTVEDDISEVELTPVRTEDSVPDSRPPIVYNTNLEGSGSTKSPVLSKAEPTDSRSQPPQSPGLPATSREGLSETKLTSDPSLSPNQAHQQLTAASPFSGTPQPSVHAYRASSEIRPASPPFHNYPQNQYFSPSTTAPFYYPMPYPNGLPPHMQGFSSSGHPNFPAFGTAQSPFPSFPAQSPPLQRQGSLSSKTSNMGDPPESNALPPQSAASAELALLASAGSNLGAEEDASDLLHRIQSAIPDLHQLLNRYRETSGQLGMREELIRKAEAQQADALKQKEYYIDSLCKQLEITAHKHSAESSKLRLEIGNLEEKTRELADSLAATEKSKNELAEAKRVLEDEKIELQRRLGEEKEALQREFEAWKLTTIEDFETQKKGLADDFERRFREQEDDFHSMNVEMSNRFLKEKETMRHAFGRQKRELEANYDKLRRELEGKLGAMSKDLEIARSQEREGCESWARERAALVKGWDEERAGMGKGWEEQRQVLLKQQKVEMEEMQRKWRELQAESAREATEKRVALEREKEALRKGWNADKEKFDMIIGELKAVTNTLDGEKRRLERMVETFGEATDLRSKGDTYFIDAFSQLRKQIIQLSEEHFQNIPIAPPKDVLARVPSGIPSFLANTDASRKMRQAYIQHIVSSVLTYRIFHPFLFTLGRRYDGADILFQDMSRKLRHKSTRREAVWRQHTLHAAYSVSSAKQSINKIATVIIDEIVSQIKHFADPKYLERITTAVRRVVKIAAETWRYARLERELIFARMPAAEDSGENISEWSEGDGEDRSNVEESTLEAREPRRVLLRLLPIIRREPTHEDLRDDSKVCDTGCLYSRGVALFSDSPPVLARIQELQQYGFEAPISPGQVGPVEQPGNSIQQSNVVPSVTSVQGPSIPTMSKLSLVEPPINILERTGAHISDGKEIVQPGENGKPQGELLELQRNRSNNSALPNNSGASGSSERSNSGSSPDAIGDLPSFRPRTAKEDTVPNWGAPGGEVPGNRDGW